MSQDSPSSVRPWPACLVGGVLTAALFLAVWIPVHPARPHLPTSDLYTHLSVARNLVQGNGFTTDVTYPLSFAFPFARELPQPLIHRQPGFAVLLTVPYLAADGDPTRSMTQVRGLQFFWLGLVLTTGTAVLWRRRNQAGILPWLILLFFNPLLAFAVDWGMEELVCSLLLLGLWLRMRAPPGSSPGPLDGLLAGLVCLLRLELFWVPLLWWILTRSFPSGSSSQRPSAPRRWPLVLLVWLLVVTPWTIRNLQVTGQPFFNLQSYAEHLKDTRVWPGYSVYRQLDPQPFLETMTSDPVPVLRKVARGMKFYFRDLDRLVPALGLAYLVWAFLAFGILRFKPGARVFPGTVVEPPAFIALTVFLLCLQYSFFNHSLRHLLVVMPVLIWEFSSWIGTIVPGVFCGTGRRFPLLETRGVGLALAVAVALVAVLLFPCRLPGWDFAATEAVNLVPVTSQQIDDYRSAPAGVLFVENSAVPWYLDRPVVWAPTEPHIRQKIAAFLNQPEARP